MWTLVAAFLVFFMQAGFMFLEAGFARTRETVNVLLEGIVDTCLCGLLFWAWGFAFMFGAGNGFIGHQYFFLQGAPGHLRDDGRRVPGVLALPVRLRRHLQHHHVGRDGRPHRLRRRPLYSIGVSGFIYPILGHWAWGPDGWLTTIKPAAVPRLRRLDGRAHHRRLHRPRRAPSPSARASAASSSATAAARCPATT